MYGSSINRINTFLSNYNQKKYDLIRGS